MASRPVLCLHSWRPIWAPVIVLAAPFPIHAECTNRLWTQTLPLGFLGFPRTHGAAQPAHLLFLQLLLQPLKFLLALLHILLKGFDLCLPRVHIHLNLFELLLQFLLLPRLPRSFILTLLDFLLKLMVKETRGKMRMPPCYSRSQSLKLPLSQACLGNHFAVSVLSLEPSTLSPSIQFCHEYSVVFFRALTPNAYPDGTQQNPE